MEYTDEAIKKRKNRITKIKSVFSILIYICLIPLLIYNITLIIQSVINPNETPSFFGIKTYVIISGSMLPELDIGDIVIVKDEEQSEYKEGDIISFREDENVITHRISKIIEENGVKKYVTKGDNNNTEDLESIEREQIEGKVIGKISFLGKLALLLQGKIVIITIVILLYLYISISIKIKNKKKIRRKKRVEYEKLNKEDK